MSDVRERIDKAASLGEFGLIITIADILEEHEAQISTLKKQLHDLKYGGGE